MWGGELFLNNEDAIRIWFINSAKKKERKKESSRFKNNVTVTILFSIIFFKIRHALSNKDIIFFYRKLFEQFGPSLIEIILPSVKHNTYLANFWLK